MLASHLDPDTLASLRDCMEEEYVGLIETFLVDCEERIAALKQFYGVREHCLETLLQADGLLPR